MSVDISPHPQLLALLDAARERPEDDGPRQVLGDWLEDNGRPERAEFVRLQLRLAPGTAATEGRGALERRCRSLLSRHGGAWLGPLWHWRPAPLSWHRGLPALRLPRRYDPNDLDEALPWADSLQIPVAGRLRLREAVKVLAGAGPNHLSFDLWSPFREEALLEELARLPASPFLRTLSFRWPLAMLGRGEAPDRGRTPAVSTDFLIRLLGLLLSRSLTHLASTTPFTDLQQEVVRRLGVEPVHAARPLWMFDLPPSCFHQRRPS